MEIKFNAYHLHKKRKTKNFIFEVEKKSLKNEMLYIFFVLKYTKVLNTINFDEMPNHHGTGNTPISFFNSSYKSLYSACSRTKTVTVPRLTPIAAPNS